MFIVHLLGREIELSFFKNCRHINSSRTINEDLKIQQNQGLTLQFCCNVCNYSTWNKAHLKRHMAVHTGEKPFACPVCGRRFSLKWNMKSHMIVHQKSF